MQVASPLPQVDLCITPGAKHLSPERHERFLGVMRRSYARLGRMYRLSGLATLATVFVKREIGYWLTIPSLLLGSPAMVCTYLLMSSDMVKILLWQYEFWFFTALNTINWVCFASFYWDARILSLVTGLVGTQMIILIDCNFRTITSALRSTVVAIPVLLIIAGAAFFRVLDIDDDHYHVIPVAKVNVTLVDVFVNTAVTLAVFIARKAYSKRKVLRGNTDSLKTIRCVVFRSKLRLKPTLITEITPQLCTVVVEQVVSNRTVLSSPNLFSSARVAAGLAEAPGTPTGPSDLSAQADPADGHQQVTLVTMKLTAVDVRHTLWPRLTPLHGPVPLLWSIVFGLLAITGLVCTILTLTRTDASSDEPIVVALAVLALLATFIVWFSLVVCYQRDLLHSLLYNFDFLFSSVQFTLAMLLIADMCYWDYRALGAFAWWLWFHVVLCLDALTPPIKRNLRIRKAYALPFVIATLVGIILIVYAFFFADIATYFKERTLWQLHWGNRTIGLRTKSLLLNRLFTIVMWSMRLIWEVSMCPDDELIFIRGGLDYYTPMEMFPPIKPEEPNRRQRVIAEGVTLLKKTAAENVPRLSTLLVYVPRFRHQLATRKIASVPGQVSAHEDDCGRAFTLFAG
ncbi:hypothetical protein Poli38472_010410 [Pythium oligandrum]|uniref:Uncharacterized protein n=1 Tax=Pythium oligandrum TaxID=41045 RepID=A0A8K1FE54_PYTOL|nr:hypothetical protein Poli38472_010410 [Pythium oligandrum]|eukprot:TMW55528.1 hypothetical protein Poli38472_010410 [Pythium oligandrum]